ncbi:MAG: HIT domain-containing protein [Gaiellaceae bacterium]
MGRTAACVFCRLVRREGEVTVVYEDERTIVFVDIQPVVRGHLLVVPRAHAACLADLDPEDGASLFRTGQRAAAALRASGLPCEGVNLFLADGEAAGQDVFHAHLHVIPRHAGDGFGLRLPPDYSIRPRIELEEAGDAVRHVWPATT